MAWELLPVYFPALVPTSPFGEAWAGPSSWEGASFGGGQAQAGLAGQSCDSWAWRIPPSSPRQASSQGPHCPGKSRHCFLPVIPPNAGTPPAPIPQTAASGPGLGSVRLAAGFQGPRAPCLPRFSTTAQIPCRKQGDWGAAPASFLSCTPTRLPSSFLPAGSWTWEGAGAGAGAGSRPRGSRKRRKQWGGWGAGAWAIVPFFSGKKTRGKTEDGSLRPRAFRESPSAGAWSVGSQDGLGCGGHWG